MKRPRDKDKAKLYRAEVAAFDALGRKWLSDSHRGVDIYARGVMASRWWQRWFKVGPAQLRTADTTGRAQRGYGGLNANGQPYISIPWGGHHRGYVLHELIHAGLEHRAEDQHAWHGPEFRWLLLHAYEQELGVGAKRALKAAFRAEGLDYKRPRL